MRRLLSLSLCVATAIGLTACDQTADEPTTEAEQELFDFRATPFPDGLPNYEGNDAISLRRPNNNVGGGGDIIVFDIADEAAFDRNGLQIQSFAAETIVEPDTGATMCTTGMHGVFKELRDSDGAVLFSALGPWTFDGRPDLAGKNPWQQYLELQSRLRYTFSGDEVLDMPETLVESSAPLQFASRWRKLVVASLVEGYCGSEGLDDED